MLNALKTGECLATWVKGRTNRAPAGGQDSGDRPCQTPADIEQARPPTMRQRAARVQAVRSLRGPRDSRDSDAWRALESWSGICVAAGSASYPKSGLVKVIVFADHDRNFAGHRAAYALAHRLATSGLGVEVKVPPDPGTDWNDVWNARRQSKEAASTSEWQLG